MRRDPFKGSVRQWIEVVVEREAGEYAVHLFERDREGKTVGTRELRSEAEDCHQLDDAIVLAIALIIDPTVQLEPVTANVAEAATDREGEPNPLAPPMPPTPAPAPQKLIPASAAAREQARPLTVHAKRFPAAFVAAEALLINGVLPNLAFGAELQTRLPLASDQRTALRFSAMFLPESRQHTSFGEFGYGLSAMEAGACRSAPSTRFHWFACAGLSAGAIHAVVRDPAPLRPGDRLWLAVYADAGVAVRLVGPVWLQARVFDLIALRRWDFRVKTETGSETAFAQAALMPGAALGIGLHFD